MAERNDNLDQLWKSVAAMARRQDRLLETVRNAVRLFQLLLAEADAGKMVWEEESVSPQRAPAGAPVTLAPRKGSGKEASPEAEPAAEGGADQVYVTWLLNGVPGKKWFSRRDAKAFVDQHEFDLIANETADTLIVDTPGEQSNKPLCLIPPLIRVFLWLVLTHTHDGKALTYREIAEKLGYGSIATAARDNRIHRLRNRFNEQLGSLSDKMFGPAKNRTYPVVQREWSFCWLRETADPEDSTLLPELPDATSQSPQGPRA